MKLNISISKQQNHNPKPTPTPTYTNIHPSKTYFALVVHGFSSTSDSATPTNIGSISLKEQDLVSIDDSSMVLLDKVWEVDSMSNEFSKGTVDPTLFIRRQGKDIIMISQSPRGIFLNQSKYALESLKKYGIKSSDPVDTPMVEKSKLDEDPQGKAVDPTHYRKAYLKALHAVKRIFKYLRGTVNKGLWYPKDSSIALTAYADADHEDSSVALTAFADMDHAGCQDTRHSTSGNLQFLGKRLISWSSKRQQSAAISSMEAEYIVLSGCCAQILWMRSQLTDYDLGFNKIPIYHFIKEQIENGVIKLYFVNTEYQLADLFTKALCRDRIEFLINKMGMRSFTPETLKQLTDELDE
nr:hypothetical protein [Tanacetum cinerariifolium]